MSHTSSKQGWVWLLLAVVCIKLAFFLLDPIPKLFFGDSATYILTAAEGLIPEDRSFTYGYVLRLATSFTDTLTPLLGLQTATSATTAILLAYALHTYVHVAAPLAFAAGILYALEPIQLLYERHVMAETVSLGVFALYLLAIFRYLHFPRLGILCFIQLLGLTVVSLRFSFLPIVFVNAACLPLLAFWPLAQGEAPRWLPLRLRETPGRRGRWARLMLLHLVMSLCTTGALHHAYKAVYAALSGRPRGYHTADGLMLAAVWAPVIRPEDFPVPALRAQIFDHLAYDLQDRATRSNQLYGADGLISQIREQFPAPAETNQMARATALNALKRDPLGVVRLAAETTLDYFRSEILHATIRNDLAMDADQLYWYGFHQLLYSQYYKLPFPDAQPMTLTKHYYAAALPWYWLLLLTPLLCVVSVLGAEGRVRRALIAVLLAASACIIAATALTVFPVVRYLHLVAWLFFFPCTSLCNKWLLLPRGKVFHRC